MATWGHCPTCDKLVPIRPGEWKHGLRERKWVVADHDAPDGRPCGNKKTI